MNPAEAQAILLAHAMWRQIERGAHQGREDRPEYEPIVAALGGWDRMAVGLEYRHKPAVIAMWRDLILAMGMEGCL